MPQSSLCFATAWWPAINQALTLLIRPEAWAGDLDAVRGAILDAQELLGSRRDNCPDDPNWEMFLAPNDLCTNLSVAPRFQPLQVCVGTELRAWYGTAANVAFGEAVYRIALIGRDFGSPAAQVGGNICQFRAEQLGTVIGNVWVFQWRDCLGVSHLETVPDFTFQKTNFQAKSICISSAAPFSFGVSIEGNWLCGPA